MVFLQNLYMFNNSTFLYLGEWHGVRVEFFFIIYPHLASSKCFVARWTLISSHSPMEFSWMMSIPGSRRWTCIYNTLCEWKARPALSKMFSWFQFKIKIKTVSFCKCYRWFFFFFTVYPFIFSKAFVALSWKNSSFKDHIATIRHLCIIWYMTDIWNYCDRCFHIVSAGLIKKKKKKDTARKQCEDLKFPRINLKHLFEMKIAIKKHFGMK